MFKAGDIAGHINCPFCGAQVACTVNRKANGNLYFICDGRADPGGLGCNTRCFVGAGPSNNMKNAATAASDPKEQTQDVTKNQPDPVPAGLAEPDDARSDDAAATETGDTGPERPLGYV